MHSNDRFSNECGTKECPNDKLDKKVATCNSSEVKKWIWNGGEQQNAKEFHSADHLFHPQFDIVKTPLKYAF